MRASPSHVVAVRLATGLLTLGAPLASGARPGPAADSSLAPAAAGPGRALLAQARRSSELGRMRQARQLLSQVDSIAQLHGDLALEADARQQLGSDLFKLGLLEQALREFEQSLDLAGRLGDRPRARRAELGRARCNARRGRHAPAVQTLSALLGEVRSGIDPQLEAQARLALGVAWMHVGPDSAAQHFEAALAIAQRQQQPLLEAEILQELGMATYQLGDHDGALAHLTRAAAIARTHGFRFEEMGALARAGVVHADRDEYSHALALQRQALGLALELGSPRAVANVRIAIGMIDLELQRPADAQLEFDAALRVVREIGAPRFEAAVLRRLSRAQAELGRMDAAARSLEDATRIIERAGVPLDVAETLHDRGLIEQRRGDLEAAQETLQKALSATEPLSRPLIRTDLECHLGEVARLRGDRDGAAALLDSALRSAERLAHPVLLRTALEQQALLRRDAGDLAAADSLLAAAMDISESIRGHLAGDETRIAYHGRERSLYASRVAVLYAMGAAPGDASAAHARAFEIAERARARALLDVLGGARPEAAAVDAALQERERSLAARIGALQTELSRRASMERPDASGLDSLRIELARAGREHRRTCDEIAVRSPAYGALLGHRALLGVEAVRSRVLLPGQVLLEYLVGENETYVFLVAKDRFRVARIAAGAEALEARIAAWRDAIQSGADSRSGPGTELYRLLVAPVEPDLAVGARLLIVPDGPLFHLPFAALHDAEGFLVERHAVAYAPSASILDPALRHGPAARGRSLLAVGNPTTYREQELLASVRDAQGWRLGELPYAEEEVRRIARHFRRARTLTREAATEEAVKAAIAGASHVHFATHGLLDVGEPLLSGLALAQDADQAEDGFLQVFEILGLRLSAHLVALSACNTGLGRLAGGEGVLGLTRAFLYAGADQLLMSLWEIADRPTVDLMDGFYELYLGAGMDTDRALQAAQVRMLERGRTTRDWAAFVLMGRTGPLQESSARGAWLAAAAGAALLLVLALVWRRRSARPS
jgi:CHAT domain-containing protein